MRNLTQKKEPNRNPGNKISFGKIKNTGENHS
jgi:hypothetical protein